MVADSKFVSKFLSNIGINLSCYMTGAMHLIAQGELLKIGSP